MADTIRISAPFLELKPGWFRYYGPGCKEPRAVLVELQGENQQLMVRFTKGMYPTRLTDVPAVGEFAPIIDEGPAIPFSKLWVGDRFKRMDSRGLVIDSEVWTKTDVKSARRHGPEETRWGADSYGYMGSATCSFEGNDLVKFIPVPIQ